MRALAALAALFLLATFAPASLYREPELPERSLLSFQRLPLNEEDPAQRTAGRLVYLDGWAIRSNDRRFGGISAMHVENGRITALSDAGSLIQFELGRSAVQISALPGRASSGRRKTESDAEALAVAGGKAWISFERRNEVSRFDRNGWRLEVAARSRRMQRWPGNSGGEAMLRLPDGRFLIFSEGAERPGGITEALLFDRDPVLPDAHAESVGYAAPAGFRITDAALLPDGRVLYLNRRFSIPDGFVAKLTIGGLGEVTPGAVLSGREIAYLRPPLSTDNLEALSVTVEQGRTIVWLASDDNLNPLQRTILLRFVLPG